MATPGPADNTSSCSFSDEETKITELHQGKGKAIRRFTKSKVKTIVTYLKSLKLDYLISLLKANLSQEICKSASLMPTYESLIQNNIINFHLIVYYHRELFIELYEECHKAGKEKFLRLQIAWHNRCSIFYCPNNLILI